MNALKSWRALLVREYLEHRIAFLYFPAGILALLTLSAASGLFTSRVRFAFSMVAPDSQKFFELGLLVLFALWFAYLAVSLFFFFGDAFSADRRNNAMFFWKSMPVSDLKILVNKFLAGTTMFPASVFATALVSGLVLCALLNIAAWLNPGALPADPTGLFSSYAQIAGYAIVHLALALLWYAPFLAWVGSLSTIFGRWSLPLAFVIPGLFAVVENIVFFGYGPRGGYIWSFLGRRLQFGLTELDYGRIIIDPAPFRAGTYITRLIATIDWPNLAGGLVVAAILIWAASEYRRRRLA